MGFPLANRKHGVHRSRMQRTWILGLGLSLGAGCFSPNAAPELDTDGSGTADTVPTSVGDATEGPDATAPTSGPPPATNSTDAPTSSSSTTVDPTASGTAGETGIGGSCSGPEDCASGVCVESECVPCGDAPQPDAACAESNPATPLCRKDGLSCVACTASSCDGSTPACKPDVGCVACDEHRQCPESACHLAGPDEGSCFDTADVVEVSDTSEFEDAFTQGNPGGQLVILLTPGTIAIGGSLSSPLAEVAIIGDGSTLQGGATSLFFNIPDLFYISNVDIEDGPSRAITCSVGEELWLDDTSVSDYPVALQSSCDVFVRRSQFRGDPGGQDLGATLQLGGTFNAVNTDFGPAGNPMFELFEAEIDIRYSTIAGNQTAVECGTVSSGVIRNSIIVSEGDSVDFACGLDYIDNASDEFDLGGAMVPSYDPSWFVVSDGSRFFLSPSGERVFDGIADWDEGDPLVDIEGDPRPQKAPGYPGVDEP